jgi:hypothetical protein
MKRLLIFIGVTVGSYIGWWLGEPIGLTTAFLLSAVGTFAGVYVGWWIWWNHFR